MALIKLSNNGVKNITSVGSIGTGDLVFISKQTASSSASISFTSGIDSTYKEYVFYFVNIHAQTDQVQFHFNMSTDGGSNYNVTKTTTIFSAFHSEADDNNGLTYAGSLDIAQGTGHQVITWQVGNDNDHPINGELYLFNPSSTTFVKHFISNLNTVASTPNSSNEFMAGYFNTTSALNAFQFKMGSGNMDSGVIKLYGVK